MSNSLINGKKRKLFMFCIQTHTHINAIFRFFLLSRSPLIAINYVSIFVFRKIANKTTTMVSIFRDILLSVLLLLLQRKERCGNNGFIAHDDFPRCPEYFRQMTLVSLAQIHSFVLQVFPSVYKLAKKTEFCSEIEEKFTNYNYPWKTLISYLF